MENKKNYKQKRHSDYNSNKMVLYSSLLNNIINIRTNSKSINNIKSDCRKKNINNKFSNKPIDKIK